MLASIFFGISVGLVAAFGEVNLLPFAQYEFFGSRIEAVADKPSFCERVLVFCIPRQPNNPFACLDAGNLRGVQGYLNVVAYSLEKAQAGMSFVKMWCEGMCAFAHNSKTSS